MLSNRNKNLNNRKLDISSSESLAWIIATAVPVDGSKL